jgi:hypothetical protein
MAIGIGQKVRVAKIRDGLMVGIMKQIEQQPQGQVTGYRVVDGSDIGIVVNFGNGFSTWFFEEELDFSAGGRGKR